MSVDGSDSDATDLFGDGTGEQIVNELTGQVVNESEDTEHVKGNDDGEKVEESMECEPCGGGRIPVTLRSPVRPSAEDIATHNLTHLPYRNWCPVCVLQRRLVKTLTRGLQDKEKMAACRSSPWTTTSSTARTPMTRSR